MRVAVAAQDKLLLQVKLSLADNDACLALLRHSLLLGVAGGQQGVAETGLRAVTGLTFPYSSEVEAW
jgi:hypothetical protein